MDKNSILVTPLKEILNEKIPITSLKTRKVRLVSLLNCICNNVLRVDSQYVVSCMLLVTISGNKIALNQQDKTHTAKFFFIKTNSFVTSIIVGYCQGPSK